MARGLALSNRIAEDLFLKFWRSDAAMTLGRNHLKSANLLMYPGVATVIPDLCQPCRVEQKSIFTSIWWRELHGYMSYRIPGLISTCIALRPS